MVAWRDNKGVYAASNVHALSNENNPDKTVKRYSRIEKKSIIVSIPYLLHQYNQYIGGVDLLDMMVATYRISFRKKVVFQYLYMVLDCSCSKCMETYNEMAR